MKISITHSYNPFTTFFLFLTDRNTHSVFLLLHKPSSLSINPTSFYKTSYDFSSIQKIDLHLSESHMSGDNLTFLIS